MAAGRGWLLGLVTGLWLGAGLGAGPALAADAPPGAYACTGCHPASRRIETLAPVLIGKQAADIAAYLDAYLEDGTPEELLRAINTIARSRGMSELARQTGISREALYRAFSDTGNPTLDTLLRVLKALGVRLAVAA